MTSPTQPEHSRGHPPKPKLYRTVLSIAVAALLAAWLPFSILYIDALTKHAAAVVSAGTSQRVVLSHGHGLTAPAPIVTRTSALAPGIG